ncbi:hypothetical protein PoB_003308200 [Plakobranchus ocellatus]|uniref:Uncharacterized protein n=1 Tax=Plakobranchus ocellatus TaxID=259542 RepID=A0AAV4AH43_9GAST|nr:hypothetical protein PoB_003308200 [Plakobranchus ocellatus]
MVYWGLKILEASFEKTQDEKKGKAVGAGGVKKVQNMSGSEGKPDLFSDNQSDEDDNYIQSSSVSRRDSDSVKSVCGLPSGPGASDETRTGNRRIPADLMADSLATDPPMPAVLMVLMVQTLQKLNTNLLL